MSQQEFYPYFFKEPSKNFKNFEVLETRVQTINPLHLFQLPTEVIYNIISYLNNTNDILNCLLVSKYFRNVIFAAPEVMRKFVIRLNFKRELIELKSVRMFFENYGFYIRNLKVETNEDLKEYIHRIIEILHWLPNLEELTLDVEKPGFRICANRCQPYDPSQLKKFFESQQHPLYGAIDKPADLSKLKILNIRFQDFRVLFRKAKSLPSLKKLTISVREFTNQGILIEMLNKCRNLKELEICNNQNDEKIFSEPEIQSILGLPMEDRKLTIKLRKFSSDLYFFGDELAKLIENQVDNLEELELQYNLKNKFQQLLPKFKNLKTLTLGDSQKMSDDVQMCSVTSFKTNSYRNLRENYKIFPNLEIFKVQKMDVTEGIFNKLHTLEIECLNLDKVITAKFPHLKNFITNSFKVEKFAKFKWRHFLKNISNVEIVKISILCESPCNVCVLNCLFELPKLKMLQYRHDLNGRRCKSFETPEIVPMFYEFYKVEIDTVQKTIKVCSYIVENEIKIMTRLRDYFKDFEFIEICFDDPQKLNTKNTFDPSMAIQDRTRCEWFVPHRNEYTPKEEICIDCYPLGRPWQFRSYEDEDESDDKDDSGYDI